MTRADEITAAGRGELATLGDQLAQAYVQLAGCLCAAEGTGGADKVKQGDYAWTPALQKTVELRADRDEARADVQRFEAQLDVANRELAQARAERDKAMKQRDFAKDGEDNMRFLKVLWENECGFYRAQSVARLHEIDIGRRTIRALVVACRAIHRTLWQALDQYEVNDRGIVRDMRQHVIGLNIEQAKQSGQQAGE